MENIQHNANGQSLKIWQNHTAFNFQHLAKEKFFTHSNIIIPMCPEYGDVWNTHVQSIVLKHYTNKSLETECNSP